MTVSRASMAEDGFEFSRLIAGFWRLKDWGMNDQEVLAFIEQCLELGITTMDHAMVYRSEEPFGRALALKPELRDRMEIVTKCGIRPVGFGKLGAKAVNHYDSSPKHIVASVEQSLRDLKTQYIDLLLIHRPDYLMEMEEIAEVFDRLESSGKVRNFGVSNFTTHQFAALQQACDHKLITNQVEFSPYNMGALDSGVFEQAQAYGTGPMLWSCLAAGQLMTGADEKAKRIMTAVNIVKEEVGASCAEQVIYAWVLGLPCNPFPLLGSSKIERIRQAASSEQYALTREQWYRIWEASNGAAVP
ncbi:aldo/keto reductase [Saccharophagus degradans]|uniref:Aldo/keto reductase n=1 Tax=Saccharophagus degradans TaxID=86304 RepID=A0AAW7XA50_9GAMM|nr:aldo/keto reductase [Saccharophagus degradans]MBU2986321.1 aldo/keto reductase [Saccharophagus degradans]MDO6424364.1 aldo/keto reductase [Saccharophagus degradans]MDO6608429.1 aldo/keto reductase [Saccharophagus degradans]